MKGFSTRRLHEARPVSVARRVFHRRTAMTREGIRGAIKFRKPRRPQGVEKRRLSSWAAENGYALEKCARAALNRVFAKFALGGL